MKKINHITKLEIQLLLKKLQFYQNKNKLYLKFMKRQIKTIKKNIEKIFKVNVIKVNVINQKSKPNEAR